MPGNSIPVLGTDIKGTQVLGVDAAPQALQGQPHQLLQSQLLAHLVGFFKVGHDHGDFVCPVRGNKTRAPLGIRTLLLEMIQLLHFFVTSVRGLFPFAQGEGS